MSSSLASTLEDYTRSSWRRGFALYREHPFIHAGRWFRYMTRRAWPGRLVHFADGDGNRYVSLKNNFTSLAVAVLGQRDPHVMRFLRASIGPGAVICDVGANIGTYAIPLARLTGPRGCVVAFEPHRPTRACLRHNVRRNRLNNIMVVPAAAGERCGQARLVPTVNLGEVHLAPGTGHAGLPPTPVTTIDAEVGRLSLRHVDFIKLDVEGFELAALRGATRTLAGNPDLIVQTEIVPAHAARYGFSAADLIRFFAGFGFQPHACDDEGRLHPVAETAPGDEADWFWARRDRRPPLHKPGRAP
jgi:FkbM family methyltransferase